jgi:hypothetical protein
MKINEVGKWIKKHRTELDAARGKQISAFKEYDKRYRIHDTVAFVLVIALFFTSIVCGILFEVTGEPVYQPIGGNAMLVSALASVAWMIWFSARFMKFYVRGGAK